MTKEEQINLIKKIVTKYDNRYEPFGEPLTQEEVNDAMGIINVTPDYFFPLEAPEEQSGDLSTTSYRIIEAYQYDNGRKGGSCLKIEGDGYEEPQGIYIDDAYSKIRSYSLWFKPLPGGVDLMDITAWHYREDFLDLDGNNIQVYNNNSYEDLIPYTENEWHQAMIVDVGTTVDIYINGQKVKNEPKGSIGDSFELISIAEKVSYGSVCYAELKAWMRPLTEPEVQKVYEEDK